MSRLVATFLGVGLLRPAPGTWGSLAALAAAFALAGLSPWAFLAALALVVPLAVWSIGREVARSGPAVARHDPGWIVIDEVAGQWVALLPVVLGAAASGVPVRALWPGWVAAFVLFRLFDVWKPGPIGRADRRTGVVGVLLDDLIAGAFAAAGVVALAALFHLWLLA